MGRPDSPENLLERLAAQAERAHAQYGDAVDPQRSLAARRAVQGFLSDRLDEITGAAAAAGPARTWTTGSPVFTFWNGPVDDAPALVRSCIARLRRIHPDAIVLDGRSLREHVDIPPHIAARLESAHPAHFSDYARVALLERHGGVWVDATVFAAAPVHETLAPLMDEGVLYPRWSGRQISNWLIAAAPAHPVIALQRAALDVWWRERDDLPDYFLYHRIFESLLSLVPDARRIWRRVPFFGSLPAHLLQVAMYRPWDAREMAFVLEAAPLQKLSYKYDPDSVPPGSVLARLEADLPLEGP